MPQLIRKKQQEETHIKKVSPLPLNAVNTCILKKVGLYAVVPCLNEEKNIGKLLDRLQNLCMTSIVVDDGSTDRTAEIAKNKGAIVIRHPENRGPGAAIKTGYIYAKNSYERDSIVFVVAGDGQHSLDDMPIFVHNILNGRADYVVGERFSKNPCRFGMPAVNFVFGRLLNWVTSLIIGIDVKDSTCGFAAIRMSALRRLKLNLPARAGETHEMLLECTRCGLQIVFVPIKPIYGKKSRISRFTLFQNVLKVYLRALREM